MAKNEQQTFDDLLNSAPPHPCEGCKLFVDGKCTYPFSRKDYCMSGSKKVTKENK